MFRELQKSIVPNIPVLRGLIRWFDAVSDTLDTPTIYASGRVLSAGTFADDGAQRAGFAATIDHPTPGWYSLVLTVPVADTDRYIVQATLSPLGITMDSVYTISAGFVDTGTIRVQIRRVIDVAGTPTFEAADAEFSVAVQRLTSAQQSLGVPA